MTQSQAAREAAAPPGCTPRRPKPGPPGARHQPPVRRACEMAGAYRSLKTHAGTRRLHLSGECAAEWFPCVCLSRWLDNRTALRALIVQASLTLTTIFALGVAVAAAHAGVDGVDLEIDRRLTSLTLVLSGGP